MPTPEQPDNTPDGPFCTECGRPLQFVGFVAAPGTGRSWHCRPCEKNFIELAGILIDPSKCHPDEEPPWILRVEDVI